MAGVNDNLIPPQKGEVRNPKGKPKGTLHLSTRIKNILESELDWSKVPIKNGKELQDRYGKDGWKAIIYVAVGQAISGNKEAREWLSKTAYGEKLKLETDNAITLIVNKYGLKGKVDDLPTTKESEK